MQQRTITVALACLLALLLLPGIGLAQKGSKGKPPKDPPPPPDPAIAFTDGPHFGGDLVVMNADGSNQATLISQRGVDNYSPNWSPDGSQLVFASNIQGRGIYIINKDGSGLHKVTDLDDAWGARPVWSPNPLFDSDSGQWKYKIAFREQPGSGGQGDLFLINVDGTGRTNITNTSDFDEFSPTWSPSAQRLAAQVYELDPADPYADVPPPDLVVYDLNSDGTIFYETNLTGPGTPFADWGIRSPDWARTQEPSQELIAVSANPPDRGEDDILIFDADSLAGDATNLTETPTISEHYPSWSPDNLKLVLTRSVPRKSKEPSGIVTINAADGSGAKQLSKEGVKPDWRR